MRGEADLRAEPRAKSAEIKLATIQILQRFGAKKPTKFRGEADLRAEPRAKSAEIKLATIQVLKRFGAKRQKY